MENKEKKKTILEKIEDLKHDVLDKLKEKVEKTYSPIEYMTFFLQLQKTEETEKGIHEIQKTMSWEDYASKINTRPLP